ncbi:MAG: hypothetical protein R3A47_11905 [Polyangiales bacterium]
MIESVLPQASTYAAHIDDLIMWVAIIVGFWFVAAEALFFYLLFRYRKKEGVKAVYLDDHDPTVKKWINIPHWIIIGLDLVILVMAIRVWNEIKIDLPAADSTIRIVGQQWEWTFVHPGPDNLLDTADDITTTNDLHVQVGKTYHYKLEATDVLHDFSVPVFRLKQDAIPGRVITGWFTPTKTGEWDIQCAEMCGIGHGLMSARIHVESAEAHAAWVSGEFHPGVGVHRRLPRTPRRHRLWPPTR